MRFLRHGRCQTPALAGPIGLRGQGLTVFIVEQNVHHVLSSADYAYVLENGRLAMGGRGEDLLNDERLKVAYMGL